MNDPTVIHNVR